MKVWVQKARRLVFAGSVAFAVGAPTIACMGGDTATPTDTTTTPEPTPEPAKADPASKIIGNLRMVPDEARMRELKIIDAAMSGKPQKKEKLGDLTSDEQKLFNEWKDKSGPEAKAMKSEIKFSKGCQFIFTDKDVTVKFDEEQFGPVSYTVVSATDSNTTVKFDPGLGNGEETHSIDWTSDTKGTDHISCAGCEFSPLNVSKR